MADRDEMLRYLDELLQPQAFADHCPNGLQVPGGTVVDKIVTGVSATRALFEAAVARDAGMVIAHHGIFWDGAPAALTPSQALRLKLLLSADINLAAYHLPLDAHPEVGNNALLCAALGLERAEPFGVHRGTAIGWIGNANPAIDADDLTRRIMGATGREPLFFAHGPEHIARVAIVSGAAAGDLAQAVSAGADAFITGEPAERVMADSAEAGIHFAAAGHYATETFGVRRLGELLAERFGVEHEFVDLPNPI